MASWPPWAVLGDWLLGMTGEEEGWPSHRATAGRAMAGDPAQPLALQKGDTEARGGVAKLKVTQRSVPSWASAQGLLTSLCPGWATSPSCRRLGLTGTVGADSIRASSLPPQASCTGHVPPTLGAALEWPS